MNHSSQSWNPNPSDISSGIVFRSINHSEVKEAIVVLNAVGIEYNSVGINDEYIITVSINDAPFAVEQLKAYREENLKNITQETTNLNHSQFAPLSKGVFGALIYVAVILLFEILKHNNFYKLDLVALGSAQAGLIIQGEWWRAVTALTLHSGFTHLFGNISFGVFFGLFAGQVLGTGVAWLSILLSGIIGNLLSALIHSSSHTSIGASTAIFAALGIQSAITWRMWHMSFYSGIRRWSPIIGGVILLGMLGGPGERIDVISHITGFISGIFFGAIFDASTIRNKCKDGCQVVFGLLALIIIALSWAAAIDF